MASNKKLNEFYKILGENIKKYRKKNSLTLEQLGLSIGVDKSAMHRIENGKPITITTLLKISTILEVPANHFFANTPKFNKEDFD
jgi:transcriptional regulator with XRE-family HTH domain